jgi:ribosomal protein S18 acetylase RimI-like enzyme
LDDFVCHQTGFGAFDGERIIGFATVSHRIFRAAARYVQLVCFLILEASSVFIQVFAAVVAGSTPGQWSTDAKGEIRMQEITFAKGNEQQLKDCRDALCRSTLGERYFSSPGSAENAILEGIRQENLYVAFIGEECVGFTYIIPKGAFHSFPYLHIIAVKEEYRNKGIGKALLDYSENIAYEMADRIFLVVADYNPDAKRFYERNGYQQVGEIPNLYRPGVTEYMMAKDLKK